MLAIVYFQNSRQFSFWGLLTQQTQIKFVFLKITNDGEHLSFQLSFNTSLLTGHLYKQVELES